MFKRIGRAAPIIGAFALVCSAVLVEGSLATPLARVTLTADGKLSATVPAGTGVKLVAGAIGKVRKTEQPVQLNIVGMYSDEKRAHVFHCGHTTRCVVEPMPPVPVTGQFQAFLVGKSGHVLAHSRVVKVEWVNPPREEATSVSIGDGHGTTVAYFAGDKTGQVSCQDGATPDQSHCDTNQQVGGGNLTITASVDAPLPSGDALWITYDSGNALDPNYQSCVQPISTQVGQCVLKTTTNESVQASVAVPASKTDYGGMHILNVHAEVHSATSLVGRGSLSILLCESGACG